MTNIQQDVIYVLAQSPLKTLCGQKNVKSTTTPTSIFLVATTQKRNSMSSPLSLKRWQPSLESSGSERRRCSIRLISTTIASSLPSWNFGSANTLQQILSKTPKPSCLLSTPNLSLNFTLELYKNSG